MHTTEAAPTILAIHVAPGSRLPMRSVTSVEAEAAKGLVGDRYHGTRHRHVSVQSASQLADAAGDLGSPIGSGDTRRNITISHGEVPVTPGARIRLGAAELEVVRVAAPCRLLDDVLGDGARTALSRRAGSICRVLAGGTIAIGDTVDLDG
ncbi:MAG TPA: MOSC domain-containing protein [Acidimicrobiales bacterium]|nr:MOSC domain-containing protein [Acidimicrobiales bacterium]